jgi:di/tricarboxylate transporter
VLRAGEHPIRQLVVMCTLAAVLSAFMNNTGALALLMPVAVQLARSAGRPPSRLLMPLAFASLLGGLVTLIGTPPNIIVSTLRRDTLGDGFRMFDFAQVGASLAALGLIVLVAAARLVPQRDGQVSRDELFELEAYTTELRVPPGSAAAGKRLHELLAGVEDAVIAVLIRGGRRLFTPHRHELVQEGDQLIVEADAETIQKLVDDTGLALAGEIQEPAAQELAAGDVELLEAVVRPGSPLVGRSAKDINLRRYYQVNLLAVARGGRRTTVRLSRIRFLQGDVLLLQGELPALQRTMSELGCLPLAQRDLNLVRPRRLALSIGLFGAAVAVAAVGLMPIEIAFAAAATLLILLGVLRLQEAYDALDLPVLVLLGAMLPVGQALETSGGAQMLADLLLGAGERIPPWGSLLILLTSTAILTNLMNNAAVAVVMAPVGLALAAGLEASPDPFLMAVAVGAGSAFLTPIGHQCNALVMGPGGYRFGDYWRLGLPMTILVAAAGVPLILWAWPLY